MFYNLLERQPLVSNQLQPQVSVILQTFICDTNLYNKLFL